MLLVELQIFTVLKLNVRPIEPFFSFGNMNRLCSLSFDFPKVVRQHISGALVDLIPSLSALHLRMRQCERIIKIGPHLREL